MFLPVKFHVRSVCFSAHITDLKVLHIEINATSLQVRARDVLIGHFCPMGI